MAKSILGRWGITALVIADSVSTSGKRITTFELEYPRFIHSELMTHRLFSRNAASSRAIPIEAQIARVVDSPAMPIHWGANRPGMTAGEEVEDTELAEKRWVAASKRAVKSARKLHEAGLHKQIVNRVLEPFSYIKTVLTSTEFDNFFWLRNHEAAQPEINELAAVMSLAREISEPVLTRLGQWHLPYANTPLVSNLQGVTLSYEYSPLTDEELDVARKISASCCAQVSYRKNDDSVEKADRIYDMLIKSDKLHASPFEHQATPMDTDADEPLGLTHVDTRGNIWSGNFCGWAQNRQLIHKELGYESMTSKKL